MSQTEEIIRTCMETWSQEQQDYAAQLGESLAVLESYQKQLLCWQEELDHQAAALADQQAQLETERKEFASEQAVEISATAELDQARAEINDLRQQLADYRESEREPVLVGSTDSSPPARAGNSAIMETVDSTVSAVAKQFQKLRDQQAARRTAAR